MQTLNFENTSDAIAGIETKITRAELDRTNLENILIEKKVPVNTGDKLTTLIEQVRSIESSEDKQESQIIAYQINEIIFNNNINYKSISSIYSHIEDKYLYTFYCYDTDKTKGEIKLIKYNMDTSVIVVEKSISTSDKGILGDVYFKNGKIIYLSHVRVYIYSLEDLSLLKTCATSINSYSTSLTGAMIDKFMIVSCPSYSDGMNPSYGSKLIVVDTDNYTTAKEVSNCAATKLYYDALSEHLYAFGSNTMIKYTKDLVEVERKTNPIFTNVAGCIINEKKLLIVSKDGNLYLIDRIENYSTLDSFNLKSKIGIVDKLNFSTFTNNHNQNLYMCDNGVIIKVNLINYTEPKYFFVSPDISYFKVNTEETTLSFSTMKGRFEYIIKGE